MYVLTEEESAAKLAFDEKNEKARLKELFKGLSGRARGVLESKGAKCMSDIHAWLNAGHDLICIKRCGKVTKREILEWVGIDGIEFRGEEQEKIKSILVSNGFNWYHAIIAWGKENNYDWIKLDGMTDYGNNYLVTLTKKGRRILSTEEIKAVEIKEKRKHESSIKSAIRLLHRNGYSVTEDKPRARRKKGRISERKHIFSRCND